MDPGQGRNYYVHMAHFYLRWARITRDCPSMHAAYLRMAGERRRMALHIVAHPNLWGSW